MPNEILAQLDVIKTALESLDKTSIKQQTLLEEHMRRTAALEELLAKHSEENKRELEPLTKHVAMWSGAMKALTVAGILFGIIKVFVNV